MPEIMKYIKDHPLVHEFVFKDADGVDVKIDRTANIDEVLEDLKENREEAGLEEKEEENKQEEKIDFGEDFTSFEQIEEAFKEFADSTSGIDLTSDENSNKDVLYMCEKMLRTVMRCKNYDFSDEEREKFSKYLEYAGYRDYDETNDKYKEFDREDGVDREEITLEKASQTKGSLYLPLIILRGLVNQDKKTFDDNLVKLRPGGENEKYIVSWFKTQEFDRERNMIVEDQYIHVRTYKPVQPIN